MSNNGTTAAPEQKKRREPLILPRLQEANVIRQHYFASVEHGTTLEEVLYPGYWAHVAPYLKPYARIDVSPDDQTWYAELLVVSCDRNWAKVHVLSRHELVPQEAMPLPEQFEVKFRGPFHKWCVLRKADSAVLKSQMAKDEAELWAREHKGL